MQLKISTTTRTLSYTYRLQHAGFFFLHMRTFVSHITDRTAHAWEQSAEENT